MFVASAIASSLLATLLVYAAARKLSHREEVVETYTRVGVPEDKLDYLALILVAGAAGLVVGLAWAPLGVAAAACLVCYFLVAVGFHVRADDLGNLPTPLLLALLAAAALVTRLAAS